MNKKKYLIGFVLLFIFAINLTTPINAGSNEWNFKTDPIQLTNWLSSHAQYPDIAVDTNGVINFVFMASDTHNM
ncbi:MAG: hypothetical protein ACTSUG_18255, partial [Candidatus Helarchaeota archaeon]